ncbi:MAG: magnesium and cobalt transport protein CorA [Proteobacteria bacterium]|nr:magnesium and cobalt transport protein CorA [Pseudomonadota bacterium]
MFRTRFSIPGTAPATLSVPEDVSNAPPRMRFTHYSQDTLEEQEVTSVSMLPPIPTDGSVLWVELDGLTDLSLLQDLGKAFDLHPLALEDVLNLGQRPKVEPYENHLFIVSQMMSGEEDGAVSREQVSIFLGQGFLLSIEEDPSTDTFQLVHHRLRTARGLIRKQGADYLAYALMDAIVDHKFPLLERLGEALDELDDHVVSNPSISQVHQLHDCKRLLAHLRRFVWPEREVISALLHDESGIVRRETKIYLRDCYDHTVQIMDLIESYRDVATANMDMYLSAVGMRTNEIMRVLTVISSIFIPLTFLAGIWGMNFQSAEGDKAMPWNMPELHHPLGYVGCLLLMLTIALVQVFYFKRKKWL